MRLPPKLGLGKSLAGCNFLDERLQTVAPRSGLPTIAATVWRFENPRPRPSA